MRPGGTIKLAESMLLMGRSEASLLVGYYLLCPKSVLVLEVVFGKYHFVVAIGPGGLPRQRQAQHNHDHETLGIRRSRRDHLQSAGFVMRGWASGALSVAGLEHFEWCFWNIIRSNHQPEVNPTS